MARLYCEQCHRPQKTCLCPWIIRQDNFPPVLIVQHDDERHHAIGTARLVELSLNRARVLSGVQVQAREVFSVLNEWSVNRPLLLYPKQQNPEQPHYVFDFETQHSSTHALINEHDALILLDGTWRNTRELLLVNTWLRDLATLELKNAGDSRYRIRQAKTPGALATIETVSKALSLFDPQHKPDQLLLPFEKMIEFQIANMEPAVYRQNYPAGDCE
jgi:DTW domain-containing protein YfiP